MSGIRHHENDLPVGLTHSDPSEASEVRDGVFDPFHDQTVTVIELLTVLIHFISEDTGIHSRRDLGGTGRFGAVTYDPG